MINHFKINKSLRVFIVAIIVVFKIVNSIHIDLKDQLYNNYNIHHQQHQENNGNIVNINLEFMNVITDNGYPCDHHYVTTSDGYILGLFRIPYSPNNNTNNNQKRQPILLQHGLLDSSVTWIINEPNESLPYILSDAGFDVWMGNNRGNLYSINHTTLSTKSREYWEFSFDEFGLYDLPAMVDYILNETGYSEIGYVGHSEGTMQAWVAYQEIKDFVNKVPIFMALGPVGNVTYIENKGLSALAKYKVDDLFRIFGFKQFLPSPTILKGLFVDFCTQCPVCCEDVVEWICGPHKGAFNSSRMSFVGGHEPGGTSLRNLLHFTQLVNDKQFQKYDYGLIGNLLHYDQRHPPIYQFSNMPTQLKIALFSGTLDELADPTDVKNLVSQLPPQSILDWTVIDNYAHLDYVWSLDAHILIYPKILQYFNSFFQLNK